MRMLFDYYETDRLVVCMDPANLDLIEDFCRDRSVTRLLEVEPAQCLAIEDSVTGAASASAAGAVVLVVPNAVVVPAGPGRHFVDSLRGLGVADLRRIHAAPETAVAHRS